MPDTTATTPSPNDLLAAKICDAPVSAGLIKDSHKAELLTKLKAGGVGQDDWNIWIDLATVPQDSRREAANV